jgi:predicted membrane metal-binding protein
MGLVLILSNAGIIGLLLFLFGIFYALKKKKPIRSDYVVVSCILIATYLFQVRYFYIFGLAGLIANEGSDEK